MNNDKDDGLKKGFKTASGPNQSDNDEDVSHRKQTSDAQYSERAKLNAAN